MNTKLIVGLGNPGKKYEHTRHNAGFIALEIILSEAKKAEFEFEVTPWTVKDDMYDYCILRKDDTKIVCIRPQTFMNLSGKAVAHAKRDVYIKNNEDILIITDELDMPLGTSKLIQNRYSKTHNGVGSIIEIIGRNELFLRIGVDSRKDHIISGEEYVLLPMTKDEQSTIEYSILQIFPRILKEFFLQD